jgi:hypothetical protein
MVTLRPFTFVFLSFCLLPARNKCYNKPTNVHLAVQQDFSTPS